MSELWCSPLWEGRRIQRRVTHLLIKVAKIIEIAVAAALGGRHYSTTGHPKNLQVTCLITPKACWLLRSRAVSVSLSLVLSMFMKSLLHDSFSPQNFLFCYKEFKSIGMMQLSANQMSPKWSPAQIPYMLLDADRQHP